MAEFKKYPSIDKFNGALYKINKKSKRNFSHLEVIDGVKTPIFIEAAKPTLTFYGTVKLHGTNACVVIDSALESFTQSRTRILNLMSDNKGFCQWFTGKRNTVIDGYKHLIEKHNAASLHIYGEWCGGNIQANVALAGINRTFVVFSILATAENGDETWLSVDDVKSFTDKENDIRNIFEFKTYDVELDVNDITKGLAEFDRIRDEVDLVCPVAQELGSTVKTTTGEGIVWRCQNDGYTNVVFKHKGESHKRSGKMPKEIKIKEPLTDEQQTAYDAFIKEAVTVDRLAQGVEFLAEQNLDLTRSITGIYLKWVQDDIKKECTAEIEQLINSGVEWSDVVRNYSGMAREFLFTEIDKELYSN